MVKQIVKDILIFKKAEPATKADLQVATDLVDTLRANADICVGMAANMIGVNKRIIAFFLQRNHCKKRNPPRTVNP